MKKNVSYFLFSFILICVKGTIQYGLISLQLPVKDPQLLALLIGQTETLIWRIQNTPTGNNRVLSFKWHCHPFVLRDLQTEF